MSSERWALSDLDPGSSRKCALLMLTALKLQSRFARGIRQRLHAPVIQIPAAVEHNFGDTLGLGPLGDGFADGFGGGDVAARPLFPLGLFALGGAGRNQRGAVQIVYHLHINVVQRAIHVQPWTLRRSLQLLADTGVHVTALFVFSKFRQHEICPWSSAFGRWPEPVLTSLSTPGAGKSCRQPATTDRRRVTSLPSFQPSSSGAHPHSVRPCSYTDPADAATSFPPLPVPPF